MVAGDRSALGQTSQHKAITCTNVDQDKKNLRQHAVFYTASDMQRSGARVGCTYTEHLSRPFTVERKLWIFGYTHTRTAYDEAPVGWQDFLLANNNRQTLRLSLLEDQLCHCITANLAIMKIRSSFHLLRYILHLPKHMPSLESSICLTLFFFF